MSQMMRFDPYIFIYINIQMSIFKADKLYFTSLVVNILILILDFLVVTCSNEWLTYSILDGSQQCSLTY